MDNVLLAQELVLDLDRRLSILNLILKLDMEKAYDRVEWPFLLFLLHSFGFSEEVVDLLFRTFSNSWFSILVNGQPIGFFKSSRGVHQGDPLSPGLFLFVDEFLGWGIQELGRTHMGSRYISTRVKVPYLAFADDTIIFTRCSNSCLMALRNFLLLYPKHLGQKVNVSKSVFLGVFENVFGTDQFV